MTIRETYTRALRLLSEQEDRTEAEADARILLEEAFSLDSAGALLHFEDEAAPDLCARYEGWVNRRLAGEPTAYLTGHWGFMGYDFLVDPSVLIPNQDTETLAEAALAFALSHHTGSILDIGAGSGCVGLSIAAKLHEQGHPASLTLSDVSPEALSISAQNAMRLGLDGVKTVRSDYFSSLEGRFDLIVSNPPYLSENDMAALERGVDREPKLALYGGPDGLDAYRAMAASWKDFLSLDGALFLETGEGQSEAAAALFQGADIHFIKDYRGVIRVVEAERSRHV